MTIVINWFKMDRPRHIKFTPVSAPIHIVPKPFTKWYPDLNLFKAWYCQGIVLLYSLLPTGQTDHMAWEKVHH